MHHFMQDQVLFSDVSHLLLLLAPFALPKLHCECFILSVEKSLAIAHLKNLVNCFVFDDLFLLSPILSYFDSVLCDLYSPV